MYYWEYILMGVLIMPALIFAIYAQYKVQTAFNKYSFLNAASGLTGTEVAKRMLQKNGIDSVQIGRTKGSLTDHYNPKARKINLSEPVYNSSSVAAIGVAAHETGHALQDERNYAPMKIRMAVIKLSNLTSSLFLPLILVGLVLFFVLASHYIGVIFIWVGVGIFSLGALANLVTLPVEINASKRAIAQLKEMNVLTESELSGAKEVLSAAALTYVAALLISLLSLARVVLVALSVTRRD